MRNNLEEAVTERDNIIEENMQLKNKLEQINNRTDVLLAEKNSLEDKVQYLEEKVTKFRKAGIILKAQKEKLESEGLKTSNSEKDKTIKDLQEKNKKDLFLNFNFGFRS